MYPYVVHIMREGAQGFRVAVEIEPGRLSNRDFAQAHHVEIDVNLDIMMPNKHHEFETWYAYDVNTAEALAKKLAQESPLSSVMVLKLCSVAQTAPSVALISNYTEKGLLPR